MNLETIEKLLIEAVGSIEGTDTNDTDYNSILDLWKNELSTTKIEFHQELEWYKQAYSYWESPENCPISDDGVLGGYGKLTPIDVKGSNEFLDTIQRRFPSFVFGKVADCGAGIGRVTKNLLLPRFESVDMIEQSHRLLEAASSYIGDQTCRVTYIRSGLQEFQPVVDVYDAIWIQWVIGHLHDIDFIDFFQRCAVSLKPEGMIFMKENCPLDYTFVVDKVDSSVSRSVEYIKVLISLAGLELVLIQQQKDFPTELYPVYMFALRPKKST